ncbi:BTAD domain-containing putative transcriptional regulator, partial [Promicromonospora sukumoe]|uniref:AfsR/SARP family transcriptional regulator n=1 Tax=Promicromonospora sukumoe TaxID=88382 RepID=UPI003658D65E
MDDGQRPAVTVAVLGPFAVTVDGVEVHLPGRLRALLAGLAVGAGAPVPVERLVEVVWGEDLPVSPQRSLQVLVSRLRSVVGDDAVETVPGGYRLAVPAGQVDVASFAALVAAQADMTQPDGAAPPGDTSPADDEPPPGDPAPSDDAASPDDPTPADPARLERRRLRDALALWRGAPFEGVGSVVLHTVDGPRLDEQRLTALARRIEIDLSALDDGARDAGSPDGSPGSPGSPSATTDALVAELRELTDRYPLQERFWGQLLTALVAAGRRAEALDAYARLDRTLADELGIGPGEALRRQHRAILADTDTRAGTAPATSPASDPAAGPATGPATATASGADTGDQPGWVPRQLPLGPLAFTGRADALAALDALLADDAAPRVVVLDGAGGVGKTTTALHWAYRVAGRFPDGQLYANLRGFDPASAPVPAGQVVRAFLEALGVAKGRVPATDDARLTLYRSVVAGRRLLVVLDNARDADQVTPLLPGPGAGPAVTVVTSRATLSGLTARAARRVALGTLTPTEGADLLALRVGAGRAAAEPEAVRRIVERCAGLPLAVVIAAARVLARPAFPLSAVADELADGGARLDALGDDDAMADVRSVFATSYRALTPDGARMFRLLGVHPGPDVSRDAAVALFDADNSTDAVADRTDTALSELVRVSLVAEHSPGRYAMHDLVAEYARERARQDEPRAARESA